MTTLERSSTQRSTGTPRWRLATFAAAVLIVTGGSAYAGNTIDGCYNKGSGALRVIDAAATQCKSSETPISWNEVGLPGSVGLTGPTGPQGPQGMTGAAGTSDAYVAKSRGASGVLDAHVDIVALNVPAGDYVISAKTRLLNGHTAGQPVECLLSTGDLSTGDIIGDLTVPLQDTVSSESMVLSTRLTGYLPRSESACSIDRIYCNWFSHMSLKFGPFRHALAGNAVRRHRGEAK